MHAGYIFKMVMRMVGAWVCAQVWEHICTSRHIGESVFLSHWLCLALLWDAWEWFTIVPPYRCCQLGCPFTADLWDLELLPECFSNLFSFSFLGKCNLQTKYFSMVPSNTLSGWFIISKQFKSNKLRCSSRAKPTVQWMLKWRCLFLFLISIKLAWTSCYSF